MKQLPYDITSSQSILSYASQLAGRSLSEVVDMSEVLENLSNKGDLGGMVERYFFMHTPPNNHDPDFAEAGVELKTTGVIRKGDAFVAKERLVLTLINYMTLVDEEWEQSSLLHKCRLMLILFYLYERDTAVYNRRFVLNPLLFSFPEEDLAIIKKDWMTIQAKIKAGKAHELSEGDTFYLGACRKGPGGLDESLRPQPFANIGAKSRAFSLKPSYVNRIISGHAQEPGTLDKSAIETRGIEQATYAKFEKFIGKSVDEIADSLGFKKQGTNDKGYYRNLVLRILGGRRESMPELEKAGIELKTIRVDENWMPKESMSFPGFKYMEIIDENWEDSSFFNKIEQKFLFVIFRYRADEKLMLEKVMYWNMPYPDRLEARRVWEDTKRRVMVDAGDLPKIIESRVAHVRPKARDSHDVIPTPQGEMLVKKAFWLNASYISEQIKRQA